MIKHLIASVCAGSLLSGCATVPANLTSQVTGAIQQAQTTAVAMCAYEPTAETVAQIATVLFPAGGPIATVALGVAKAICTSMTAKGAVLKGNSLHFVKGVLIEGHFVK